MKEAFASHVFDFSRLEENLPGGMFNKFRETVDQKKSLDQEVAETVAREIKKWAEALGVTHFTHWFMPLTGLTAGKQNTFLDRDKAGRIIASFSGKDLIKGEPDASSFPHGGMRSTFEARGYTAWDPASPVFIVKNRKCSVLYIPSVFMGYNGKVLDKKTPLLRSLKLINEVSLQILRHFDNRAKWVKNMVGPEQEFFLVQEKDYRQRPDLYTTGRTIFAARPPKGQQMGDHYFGSIPDMVLNFFEDVEEEAWKLGIPLKTRHNEVAPNQFEIAPLYEEANIAADHNQMLMDLMSKIARNHHLVCLFHEKPFAFFNGSGKHVNWSLMDNEERNLFAPGSSKSWRLVFLCFLTGFIIGLNRHHDLLQSVLASPGNELRLGGQEAPPAIISVYLGQEVEQIIQNMDSFVSGRRKKTSAIQLEQFIPAIPPDMSDRNRTSPVAFTGNKFEFRMPGASASLAFPIAVINLMVADGLTSVQREIAKASDEKKIVARLRELIAENKRILFAGDNYSSQWRREAQQRNLYIPSSTPETTDWLRREKNISLFKKYKLLNRDEVEARTDIKMEMYIKTVEMELRVARYMLRAHIIPAALRNQKLLLDSIHHFPVEIPQKDPGILYNQHRFIRKFTEKINRAMELLSMLDEDNEKLKKGTEREKANFCSAVIRPHIQETAAVVEKIEERVDSEFWHLPRVAELLFR